jgi:hypothetical protein
MTGVANIKGLTSSKLRAIKTQSYEDLYFSTSILNYKTKTKIKRAKRINVNSPEKKNRNRSIPQGSLSKAYKRYKKYITRYFKNNFHLDYSLKKINIVANSFTFYLFASTGLNTNYIVYPEPNLNSKESLLFLLVFFLCLIFFIFKFEKVYNINLLGMLVLFVPISGFFYVTYMEFSYVSDHWFYPSLIFLLIFISTKVQNLNIKKTQYILNMFIIFFVIKTLLLSVSLYSTKSHLYKNLKIAPNSVILHEYIIVLENNAKNYKQALIMAEKLYPFSNKKQLLLNQSIYFAKKLNLKNKVLYYKIKKIKLFIKLKMFDKAISEIYTIPKEQFTIQLRFLKALVLTSIKKPTPKMIKLIKGTLIN